MQLNAVRRTIFKWEKEVLYSDTQVISKLSGIFGVCVTDLLQGNLQAA